MSQISEKQMKNLLKFQQTELDAVVMYQRMADRIKNPEVAAAINELAKDEGRHAAAILKLTQKNLKPKKTLANFVACAMKILDAKALFPIIAKTEYAAFDQYAPYVKDFPELINVQKDERKHGDRITELMKLL